jgi:hypothetical protein
MAQLGARYRASLSVNGTTRTLRNVRYPGAVGGKADISQRSEQLAREDVT